jgi:hypothetical protein
LSLNMHSQQSMNYTHWAARGDMASATIPVSISATATYYLNFSMWCPLRVFGPWTRIIMLNDGTRPAADCHTHISPLMI